MIAPFTATTASLYRALVRYREIAARWPAVAPAPWPVAPAPRQTPHGQKILDAERQVLGAVITGALRLQDLQRAPDELCGHLHHRLLLERLTILLEMRADGFKIPGAPGLDWRFAERACASPRIWAIGVVSVDPPVLCSLLDLARAAPRRPTAMAALALLTAEARHRADIKAERARLREALRAVVDELVDGYLAAALAEASAHGSTEIVASRGHRAWIGPDVLREEIARHRAGRGTASVITDNGGAV